MSKQNISRTLIYLQQFVLASYPGIFQAWPETSSDTWGPSGKSENVDVDGPCINTCTGSTYNALNIVKSHKTRNRRMIFSAYCQGRPMGCRCEFT